MSFQFGDLLTISSNQELLVKEYTSNVSLAALSKRKDGIILPVGTTAERPTAPGTGTLRFNKTLMAPEIFLDQWFPIKTDFNILQDIQPRSLKNPGATATISGYQFGAGMHFEFVGSTGTSYNVPMFILHNSNSVTIVRPHVLPINQELYSIRVTLPSGSQYTL